MPINKNKKVMKTIVLNKDTYESLQIIAEKDCRSMSNLISIILDSYITSLKRENNKA